MLKSIAKYILRILYRPDVRMQHLEAAQQSGDRVLLMPHYASYMDPILFFLFSPGSPLLIISPELARKKWFRFFRSFVEHVVVDFSDPFALKKIDDLWNRCSFIILFPEPSPTTNGILMKLSDISVAAAEKSDAWIVPARACNMQFTPFSRMNGRLPYRWAPKVTLLCGEAERIESASKDARERRHSASLQVERMLMDTMMLGIWDRKPIFDTLLEQKKLWGGKHVIAIEPDGSKIDWNQFLTRIFAMEKVLEQIAAPGERIGIMLPNTSTTLALILAVQHSDREPAMINYSMGALSLTTACRIANVKRILTSTRFVEEGKFGALVDSLKSAGIEIVFLEEHVEKLTSGQKLGALLASMFPRKTPEAEKAAEKTALVLFTSGSEGTPKPVALSYLNIQANTAQVRTALDFYRDDVLLNIMPMFHSFGLCTGTFMPLSAGMATAFYPTPLHYKKIPQYAYETKASVILGTNAFLAGYAKNGDPMDFFEMRYVVCGGDKLKESTSKLWMDKFGIRVLGGYGVTEAAPVIGVNRIGHYHFGSIGKPLACIRCHLKAVEGVENAGRLVVKGPNIMKGYISEDGSILPPDPDGYDTGDIVEINEDGFIIIKGRAKRFAKIGGEMVSLTQIEEAVQEIWSDTPNAIVSIPDESRGEIIVLLTEKENPDREELRVKLTQMGLPELALPKKIIYIEVIPKIGVGKTDYQNAARVAEGK